MIPQSWRDASLAGRRRKAFFFGDAFSGVLMSIPGVTGDIMEPIYPNSSGCARG